MQHHRLQAVVQPNQPQAGGSEGLSVAQALRKHAMLLSPYEQGEILEYKRVWFLGRQGTRKVRASTRAPLNHGFDDERGDYKVVEGDHLAYRFEITGRLGAGSFGQVLRCRDHRFGGQEVAVKIIRNKRRFHKQARIELQVLEMVRDRDPTGHSAGIRLREHVYFRSHLLLVFPMLHVNLYELIKAHHFRGFTLPLVRKIGAQMTRCLLLLRKLKVVHCDLKPENVLLRTPGRSAVQVIDFGSACFESKRMYTYIQSRFYRAPEVIMGLPYSSPIDMWSLGCILAELHTGVPLFPGENEHDQLQCIMELMGVPPPHMIAKASSKKALFNKESGEPVLKPNSRGKVRSPSSKRLSSTLRCRDETFLDFLQRCLHVDPQQRLTPPEAAEHPFLKEFMETHLPSPPPLLHQSSIRVSAAAAGGGAAEPSSRNGSGQTQRGRVPQRYGPQVEAGSAVPRPPRLAAEQARAEMAAQTAMQPSKSPLSGRQG